MQRIIYPKASRRVETEVKVDIPHLTVFMCSGVQVFIVQVFIVQVFIVQLFWCSGLHLFSCSGVLDDAITGNKPR